MEKSRVNDNCAHIHLAANIYRSRSKMSMPFRHRVFPASKTAVETLKQTVAQYFNENVSALTHRQIISDRTFLGE